MAELAQADIEAKITALDAQIATLTANLGGGVGAAPFTDYRIGQFEVKGSQQLESLIKSREYYQALLQKLPSVALDTATYDIRRDGKDDSDLVGDI